MALHIENAPAKPASALRMHAERTPNPRSVKWVLGAPIAAPGQSANFEQAAPPEVSPLAARLFAIDGVAGVFFAENFVTVTKGDSPTAPAWPELAEPIATALRAHIESGEDALGPAYTPPPTRPQGEIEQRIREILENEIRPAIAMDGGDVQFAGYHDGAVEVVLQGACVGCPSSTATLRFGIEARLRQAIPEVTRVVQR